MIVLVILTIIILAWYFILQKKQNKQQELEEAKAEQRREEERTAEAKQAEAKQKRDELKQERKDLLENGKVLFFDAETTGDDQTGIDELLALVIADKDGNVLFNGYFKPLWRKHWQKAEEVHGITPEMVKDKAPFSERLEEIQKIFDDTDLLVGCNTEFDATFLMDAGVIFPEKTRYADVMRDFARINGEWDILHFDTRLQTLAACADHYGYEYRWQAYDTLADTLAIRHCFYKMVEETGDYHIYRMELPEDEKEKERAEALS